MLRWRGHLARGALLRRGAALVCSGALVLCAGCPAPYPRVPHTELAERILEPQLPSYQQPPGQTPTQPEPVATPPVSPTAQGISQHDVAPLANVKRANFEPTNSHSAPANPLRAAAEAAAAPMIDAQKDFEPVARPSSVARDALPIQSDDCSTLTLAAAIDLAYRSSPTIQKARARIDLAKANKDVAFADFLPSVDGGYRHIVGATRPTDGFVFPTIASAIGNVAFGGSAEEFGMAELHAQWTVWDFGRTTSKFGQSLIGEEIAGLQYVRSQQTVAYEVAAAYFEALEANAVMNVAEEAVQRAQSALSDAKNYLRRGNAIRNDVLRADVFLKQMQLDLVKARTAQGVAVAKLNQAIGINPSITTQVVELTEPPRFEKQLGQCLQMAVENRREFGVVEHGIAQAKLGENVAAAEFMPKVILGGLGALEQTRNPNHNDEHASAGIAIEIGLFQGGRRVGELRGSHAEIDIAVASGRQVCDQIAYEVKVAYLAIADAKERIEVSREAAAQASENMRVTRSQFEQGDVIPTDVIEAELTLTRAQQGYLIATYDYETALARLAFAVGLPPESFLAMPCRR